MADTGDIWLHMLTAGQPAATRHLGDTIGDGGSWYVQFEIGQTTWHASEAGVGTNATADDAGWSWDTATWFANGDGNNRKVQRDVGGVQLTSVGNWYMNGRAKGSSGHHWHYANTTNWGNSEVFGPAYYFTVDPLSDPTGISAATGAGTPRSEIDLSWTKWNGKSVMILRRKAAEVAYTPVQGTAYTNNQPLGNDTVVVRGSESATSITDTGLESVTTYHYKIYSENYSYYSDGVVTNATTGYDLGNCWHIPANDEPPAAKMRNPVSSPQTNQWVHIYNGNQFQGATGITGDQTGGTLYHRLRGGSWSSTNLAFHSQNGNNKYWAGSIPGDIYGRTNVVDYYIKVTYNDHVDTFIGTTNDGTDSVTFGVEAEVRTNAFTFTYSDQTESSAAYVWHSDHRAFLGSDVQCRAKIGYAEGLGSNRWVEYAAIYYTTNGSAPEGAHGVPGNGSTLVQTMMFDQMEEDIYPGGDAMWWAGTLTNLPEQTTIEYKIGAWKSASGLERFADYNTPGTDSNTFSFVLGAAEGDPVLTVGSLNADYTTTKLFIDEIAGESEQIVATFEPNDSDVTAVEIFSNLDRRDYVDVDYTNKHIAADGYPDGIRPPDGNLISTNDTGAYFRAYRMHGQGGGSYIWTGTVSRCGAYRLTARYQTTGMAPNTWNWYSSGGRRDHAIVVSPEKVHQLTMYELNTLTVEATDNTEAGRSTFVDLLGSAEGDSDGFDHFNLDYLNFIQANCLWFQPIHPNANERGDDYTPGSPYASRDYFAVTPYMGSAGTAAGAMNEFTNFVSHCDSYTGSVGTINVVLDGVFNHTSWDAEMGQGGVDLGFTATATDRIGSTRPSWYSLITDYGSPATWYTGPYDNNFAMAPDRGDFGKWPDTTELFFGRYSSLVRHNPQDNGDYLNEDDVYDVAGMSTATMDLWRYFAYYTEYWLKKTGHAGTNLFVQSQDDKGIDGLRCDFGQGLPPQAWEYIVNRTRSKKWNFVFMAETLDGGVPGYRSNRHFDILNENLVFQFTQAHINDSTDVVSALETRRSAYNGGAVLLNLTSHDEVLPDNDTWLTASRYGAVSTVDGVPMVFYGQEQGIQNYNADPSYWYYDGFETDHEVNFGKYIPHFKQWNRLSVWENPPPDATGLAQWYGRVNWARLNSPALQSPNRYFLNKVGGGAEARILAVAKYETPSGSPASNDVVLAFSLLLRHGEAHAAASARYNLQPAWDLMGMDTGKFYNVRNLASSDAVSYVWETNTAGTALYNDGIWVNLPADTGSSIITNDGALVQYLRVIEFDDGGSGDRPGPDWWYSNEVIDPDTPVTNDYAAALSGQLKWISFQAADALSDSSLWTAAGAEEVAITNLVTGFAETNNYCPINLGQLKYAAAPFYDWLIAKGVTNAYPWADAPNTNDFAAGNVGQLKQAFSFEVPR